MNAREVSAWKTTIAGNHRRDADDSPMLIGQDWADLFRIGVGTKRH